MRVDHCEHSGGRPPPSAGASKRDRARLHFSVSIAALSCSFALAGCTGPPVTSIVTAALSLPTGGKLTNTSITVPAGRALGFVAQPMNGTETLKQDITLASADDTVGEALNTGKMNQFVLVGRGAGQTALAVQNESGQLTSIRIDVEVTAP